MGGQAYIRLVILCGALAGQGAMAARDPNVSRVLGTPETGYPARMAAVKALGKTLSEGDVSELLGFLARKANEDKSLPGDLNAIKNDVVNALKRQEVIPADLVGHLMDMYGDQTHDEVWRDYCIQHLGDLYPEIKGKEAQSRALGILWAATGEKQGSIPGTALIALFSHAGTAGFGKDRIATKALEMVRASEYGEPARITALQVAAKLGEKSVLPDARKLATNSSIPIRVSAMACLGILGNESDFPVLKASQDSTDIRLRTAARAAVKTLSLKKE